MKKKTQAPLKLDLGCGTKKKEGFVGVDVRKFAGVDVVCDLGKKRWPWKDGSVDEIHASHFIEHLTGLERVHFANEAYRVLKKGGTATIVAPHWCASRAYGDYTHQWPPVSEFWFFYLSKKWRDENAPHNDAYTCDFDSGYGYNVHPEIVTRAQDHQVYALGHYKEMAQDIVATLTKPGKP